MNYYGNSYLMHYGVLGMKWGQHRAAKNVTKAANRKASAKEWDELSKEARKRGNTKQADKYKRYAAEDRAKSSQYSKRARDIESKHVSRTDQKTYDRVKKTSTVKLVGESLAVGTYGALKYNEVRANGASRGLSILNSILYSNVNAITGGLMSIVEPRVKESENRRQRR